MSLFAARLISSCPSSIFPFPPRWWIFIARSTPQYSSHKQRARAHIQDKKEAMLCWHSKCWVLLAVLAQLVLLLVVEAAPTAVTSNTQAPPAPGHVHAAKIRPAPFKKRGGRGHVLGSEDKSALLGSRAEEVEDGDIDTGQNRDMTTSVSNCLLSCLYPSNPGHLEGASANEDSNQSQLRPKSELWIIPPSTFSTLPTFPALMS